MASEATGEANAEQIEYWNEQVGPRWVTAQELVDARISPLGLAAMERAGVEAGETVLDVGCGCGESSLQLGERVGPDGSVLGLDVSRPMLARARERAEAAGASHVRFREGDAQVAPLEPAHDLVFSRFGVMFFADPVAAFANLRGALRPGGRLAFVCWQDRSLNPWMMEPLAAIARHVELPAPPPPDAPGPFALADPDRLRAQLARAGFARASLEDERRELGVGGDVDDALHFLTEAVGPTSAVLAGAEPGVRAAAIADVRALLERHAGPEGVTFGAAAWLVRAET